jgi:hypothetical protein
MAFSVDGGAQTAPEDEKSIVSVQSNDIDENQGDSSGKRSTKEVGASIAVNESKAVRWIRVVAIAVIVLSTVGVSVAVHQYMNNNEKKTFVYRFESDSYKILESIGSTFDRSMGSVDTYATGLVSLAEQSNQTWPYVTASHFPVQSAKILTLSKGILFTTYHYVEHSQRTSWSRYAVSNDAWVEESLDVQEAALNKTYFGPIDRNWSKSEDIYRTFEETFESDFYMVGWQQYPIIPAGYPSYGWDFWELPGVSAAKMFETHQAAISLSFNLPDPNDLEAVAYSEVYAEYFRDYLPPGRDSSEPFCELYYVSHCNLLLRAWAPLPSIAIRYSFYSRRSSLAHIASATSEKNSR